ncbi:uracil DNA N-glycosylase Thp1 [Gnomoniopsis smithogilvyi]|uniref:Uracil DNA N-glycosylase Thp1 n=1 Tax=Gnomoniopsis smithogilvyi TaxID=1191159 RepID=A0A9W8Z479_9PEZI|nr:uracil DNA N-glycosylase Thp1 [Gnomoniopsis smithogilvyi]
MTKQASDGEAVPPLSFTGQLEIQNFRFSAREQVQVQKIATVTRSSTRLVSKIDQNFKPTKHDASRKTPSSITRKRKVEDLQDVTPLSDTAKTRETLSRHTERKLSSKRSSDTTKAGEVASLLERSHSDVILGEDSLTMMTEQKKKRRSNREKSGYAPPSTFAHLRPLPDALAPNLHVLFCGLNPGIQTAIDGHAYSSPTNRFWKLMYSSGVLPVPCTAQEDRTLPKRFNLGLTNIVERPSRNGSQLSKAEMDAGVPVLEEKVRRWRPEVVCLVGKSIWESVWRVHHNGKAVGKEFNKAFKYGWQDGSENMGIGNALETEDGVVYADDWKGARVFVASSTSGLAATLSPAEKERIWRELGVWVEKRRAHGELAVEVQSVVS